MKITSNGYDRYQSMLQSAKGADTQGVDAAKDKSGAKIPARADTVTLSGGAAAKSELSRLTGALAAEADGAVSLEKLDALHTAVQNGTYSVASGDIADAILDMKV